MDATPPHTDLIRILSEPLVRARNWMKLSAALLLVYGVLSALTVVGLLIAWLPIWMGILLFQSAGAAEEAQAAGSSEALAKSLDRLRVYFTMVGILALIGVIFAIIGVFGGIAGMVGRQAMHGW